MEENGDSLYKSSQGWAECCPRASEQPQLTDGCCCKDDRCSSWQGAKHHRQGPLMASSLARFDSNNWDHDFSGLKGFCASEGLRECLLDRGCCFAQLSEATFSAIRQTHAILTGVPPVYREGILTKALPIRVWASIQQYLGDYWKCSISGISSLFPLSPPLSPTESVCFRKIWEGFTCTDKLRPQT